MGLHVEPSVISSVNHVRAGWFLPLSLMTKIEIQRSYFKLKNLEPPWHKGQKTRPQFLHVHSPFSRQVPFFVPGAVHCHPAASAKPGGTFPCLARRDPAELPEQHQPALRIQVRISPLVS